MSISAIANLGLGVVQGIFGNHSQPSSQISSTSTQYSGGDDAVLHPVAQLFARLDSLETANPQGFQSFVTQAATEVSSAASNQPAGATKDFLNDLAGALQNGAQNPTQPLQFPTDRGPYNIHQHPVADALVESLNVQADMLLQSSQTPPAA